MSLKKNEIFKEMLLIRWIITIVKQKQDGKRMMIKTHSHYV